MKYAIAFAAALLCSSLSAQDYRLNELPEPGAYVRDFRVASDGRHVVYLARPRGVAVLQLYLVDAQRPRERRLLDGRNCIEIELAGDRLVYSRYDGVAFHISSLLLDGRSSPVELALGNGARPTPDGRTVVFRNAQGLFSVPADGSAPPRLVQASTPAPVHAQWVLSPDSRRVVYVTEGINAGRGLVHSALLDSSAAPVALNTSAIPCGVGNHVISPDSRWVVFRRVDIMRGVGLYRVPIDGSAPAVRLHDPLPVGAEVEIFHTYTTPLFTPDSQRVLYRLEQEAPDLTELYSAPLDGSSAPVKLSDEADRYVLMFRISPDGSRVVFTRSAASLADPFDLFWVPSAGGAPPVQLNAPLVPGGSVRVFTIGPDSRTVAYAAQQERLDRLDLLSVSMDGGAPPRVLSLPDQDCFPPHPDGLEFARQGEFVVYPNAPLDGAGNSYELFCADVQGLGTPRRLSGPMVTGGSLISLDPFFLSLQNRAVRFAANGTLALFRADQEKNDVFELWAAPIPDGPSLRRP